ncbi:hypothetical protein TNCV_3827751 [Trichonephila clavipes]|nr:hypothetical protein TNCV_3827751 [Trichonephila clavipes]
MPYSQNLLVTSFHVLSSIMHVASERNMNSAGLSIGCLGQGPGGAQKGLDKLDLTRFSGYKFRFTSAKGACRSSVSRARNELKSALGVN